MAELGPHEEHFQSLERQAEATRIGMWVFLASEILLFAALFTLYGSYRVQWSHAFSEAVHHNPKHFGSINTMILLVASYLVAMALHHQRDSEHRKAVRLLGLAVLLGVTFLGVKGYEYHKHISSGILPGGEGHFFDGTHPPGMVAFFNLYYLMTGLHAVHVAVGATLLAVLGWRIRRGVDRVAHPLENGALYWHLVDAIWIFLWPMFYLTGGGGS